MTLNVYENYLLTLLPKLGTNKLRELVRLMYEIAKRDSQLPEQILPFEKNLNF